MKYKTTKKAMKENYNTILSIGYCNIQHLLNFESPIAYSASNEGWSCDYYIIDNVCISTGYSPIGMSVSHDIQRKYNELAQNIQYDNSISWEEKQSKIHELLVEFIKEVK